MTPFLLPTEAPLVSVDGAHCLSVLDMHTAGEPVRIVVAGYPELRAARLLDKRREAMAHHDHIRRQLMLEPRGHAGMYGVIPFAPCRQDVDLSVLFTHAGGYSTMCGHATIAIARWAVESGVVSAEGDRTEFWLECPCGPVKAFADIRDGRVVRSGFESVAAFVEALDVPIPTAAFGSVRVDVAYGGAYYVIAPASRLGHDFDQTPLATLVDAAAHLFQASRKVLHFEHLEEPDLAFLYGVILTDEAPWPEDSRNICVFGEGQIDRSPTGSGVTARVALDVLRGVGQIGVKRRFIGPTGEAFEGRAVHRLNAGRKRSVSVAVAGRSYYSAQSQLIIESDDPLAEGFVLSQEARLSNDDSASVAS